MAENASDQAGPQGKIRLRFHFYGVLLSLTLLGAVALWYFFALSVPQQGGIAIVKAPQTPLRVLPDQPSGYLADNQGLAVNAISANRPQARADQYELAPDPLALPVRQKRVYSVDELLTQIITENTATLTPKSIFASAHESAFFAQLDTFETQKEAQAAWQNFENKFSHYIGQKKPVVLAVQQESTFFYRLRLGGFSVAADAQRFCVVIRDYQTNCHVVYAP